MVTHYLYLISVVLLIVLEYALIIKINRKLKLNFILRTLLFSSFFVLQTSFFLLSFHFILGKYLFYYLFFFIDKILVIQDPQDYLFVLWSSGLCFLFLLYIILFIFFIHLVFSNILIKEEYYIYSFIILLFLYLILNVLIIFFLDLLFCHWDLFYTETIFDFQPDLFTWYIYYKNEFFDIVFIGILNFILYLNIYIYNIDYKTLIKKHLIFKFIPFIFFSICSLYLFGGETIIRDLFLIAVSFFSAEFIIFSKIYFENIKQYKIN